MTPFAAKSELKLAVIVAAALVCLGAGFAAGWSVQGMRADAAIQKIERVAADEKRIAAQANAKTLAAANARGDALALQLAGWENTLTAYAEEKNREIAQLVTGRACLGGDVVRVLNRTVRPGGERGGPVSETAGSAVRADATLATGTDVGRYATDADVAGWIVQCQRGYRTCSARLDAIADFYRGVSDGNP